MTAKLSSVKYLVSHEAATVPVDKVEAIRRRFALAWGSMGGSWGVPPSTAAVQGYLLAQSGPVTDRELQDALGLSHRAIRLALEDCVRWGVVRQAEQTKRTGQRGPAGRAWVALDDHWEWFHRVVAARKQREGDPVISILEQCLTDASAAGKDKDAQDLHRRLGSLLEFVREFDHALSAIVRVRTEVLSKLFTALAEQDADTLDKLLTTLASIPDKDLAGVLRTMSRLSPAAVGRLVRLASQPGVARLLGAR